MMRTSQRRSEMVCYSLPEFGIMETICTVKLTRCRQESGGGPETKDPEHERTPEHRQPGYEEEQEEMNDLRSISSTYTTSWICDDGLGQRAPEAPLTDKRWNTIWMTYKYMFLCPLCPYKNSLLVFELFISPWRERAGKSCSSRSTQPSLALFLYRAIP